MEEKFCAENFSFDIQYFDFKTTRSSFIEIYSNVSKGELYTSPSQVTTYIK
jgi:hypothetical protein